MAVKSNKRADMTFLICTRTIRCRVALLVPLLGILFTGCVRPSPPIPFQPLVGRWQGTVTAGNARVPAVWEIRADHTQSLTLTLPQGTTTAQGTWTAQDGVLTERTTARISILGGEQKVVVLASPMEVDFTYQLTGDTLALTRPGILQPTVLTRETNTKAAP